MEIRLRQAEDRDIDRLAGFEREISLISFGDEAVTDPAFHAKRLRKAMEVNADGMQVWESGGEVAGWLWMDLKTNFITQEKYVNFRSFYIVEAYRGTPEAEDFLTHGLAYAASAGAKQIVGKVHAGNLPMRALYRKAGFTATHITMEYRVETTND